MKLNMKKLFRCTFMMLLLNMTVLGVAESNTTVAPDEAHQLMLKSNGSGAGANGGNGGSGGLLVGSGGSGGAGNAQSESIPTRTLLPPPSNQNPLDGNTPKMPKMH